MSTDSAITESDTYIGNITFPKTMDDGASYSFTADSTQRNNLTIPSNMPAGTYYVGVIIIPVPGNAPVDRDRTNNDIAGNTVTICSFPNKPINPYPSNGATVPIDVQWLGWDNGGGASSYDIYFGTDSTPDSGEYKLTN